MNENLKSFSIFNFLEEYKLLIQLFIFKQEINFKIFKNEIDLINFEKKILFLFFIIIQNINIILNLFPTGDIYMKIRKIFFELRIISITIERIPGIDSLLPLIKKLNQLKQMCRDLEILFFNFDKLINWSHRTIFIEKFRFLISSIISFIRLIYLINNKNKKRYYKKKKRNFNEIDIDSSDYY